MNGFWPDDLRDAVLLARAADQIGRAKFGSKWTGEEFTALLTACEPLKPRHDPLPIPRSIVQLPYTAPFQPCVANTRAGAHNSALTEYLAGLSKKAQVLFERRGAVVREIIRGAEAGTLVVAYLDQPTGGLHPTPRDWWRGEVPDRRFEAWRMDWQKPFSPSQHVATESWLFVDRATLAETVASLRGPVSTAEERVVSTSAAEKRFTLWLTEHMRRAPADPLSKKIIRELAEAEGFSIGVRPFETAWSKASKDAHAPKWRAAGRRSTKSD